MDEATKPRDVDYRVCLDLQAFKWAEVAQDLMEVNPAATAKSCYEQYWRIVGLSESNFKREIIGKRYSQKYAKIDGAIRNALMPKIQPKPEPVPQMITTKVLRPITRQSPVDLQLEQIKAQIS